MARTLLRHIRPYQLNFEIRVRVLRIWRPKRFQSEIYDGLHYVLVDEEGTTIHAMIKECDYLHVDKKMQEGKIYDISLFATKKHFGKYKIVDHEIELYFNESTKFEHVEHTSPPIPEYAFNLLDFSQFKSRHENQVVLIDIYGSVKAVVPEHQVHVKDENKLESKCEVVMENLRFVVMSDTISAGYMRLWDVARDFDVETIQALPPPVLAVLTSLRITKFQEQMTASATNHTCIFLNPAIPGAQEYAAEFSKQGDKIKLLPPPARRLTPDELKQQAKRPVADLNALNPDAYTKNNVFCTASIRRFSVHDGWWYKACPRCHRQVKPKEDSNELTCGWHDVKTPVPWYRVCMTIHDDNNHAAVTLIGTQAEQLFGISCEELLSKQSYPTQEIIPMEMEKTVGETYLFEIKVNPNNELTIWNIFPAEQPSPSVLQHDPSFTTPDQQPSASVLKHDPSSTTPDRLAFHKKRGVERTGTALFTSESDKKAKSDKQTKHGTRTLRSSTSSSTSTQQPEKEKHE